MNLETNTLTIEISNALAATGDDYTTTVSNLGIYGTSCEITKRGSDRKLHITPVDGELLDMVLFDETGAIVASGTLLAKIAKEITSGELTNLITICF